MHGKKMTLEDYLASPVLADPLRMFDSCLISDGGAAFVTTSIDRARDLRQPPAGVAGGGEGTPEPGAPWSQQRALPAPPQGLAAPPALPMAGREPGEAHGLAQYEPRPGVSVKHAEDM